MAETPWAMRVGAATVTVVNVGDSLVTLAQEMNVPESAWRPDYTDVFARAQLFPSQCVHVALPGVSLLVDAGDYARSIPPGAPYRPPEYEPPPGLVEQLAAAGIDAASVTHVLITHAHFDHYSGVTRVLDGRAAPAFPHARCYLGRADWEDAAMQAALREAASDESSTLGIVHGMGLLELVDGDRELMPGVRMIAAPGESPGHYVVRMHSRGQTLYCLGDLIHHPVEVEHPAWMSTWADVERNLASRGAIFEAALAEHALLVAAHIATVGRLECTAAGLRWVDV
jgi:glyoxylase-like metal-dependent hydrolase (beta-lactamase superfamily II)